MTLPEEVFERVAGSISAIAAGDATMLDRLCDEFPEHASSIRSEVRRLLEDTVVPGRLEDVLDPIQAFPSPHGDTFGRFEIEERIGRGGMGEVFRVLDPERDEEVALKVMLPDLAGVSEARERFLRESRAVRILRHPSIVDIRWVGRVQGLPCFTMEYIEGAAFSEFMVAQTPEGIARVVADVADALEYAHGKGVLHRDVKPANILVRDTHTPVLVDFGLARVASEEQLTRSGVFLGSLAYSSPEQLAGGRVDARTDVWSLGVTLYQALTRELPFAGQTESEIQRHIESRDPRPIRAIDPSLPGALEKICSAALQKPARLRYASAGAMCADLRRFLDGKPVQVRLPGPVTKAYLVVRRNPLIVSLVMLTLLLVTSAGWGWSVSEARTRVTVANARLMLENRQWPAVLAALERVERAGYSDHVELALMRFQALEGLGRLADARSVLASLSPEAAGEHRATVLLLRGDFDRDRVRDPKSGLASIQEALDLGGLSSANESYASGVLAQNVEDARRHFELALNHKPSHWRANLALCWMHLMAGDWSELDRRLTFLKMSSGSVPAVELLDWTVTAVRALARYPKAPKVPGREQAELVAMSLRAWRGLIRSMSDFAHGNAAAAMRFLGAFELFARCQGQLQRPLADGARALAIHPLLSEMWIAMTRSMAQAIGKQAFGKNVVAARELLERDFGRLLSIHDDGALHCLLGLLAAAQGKPEHYARSFDHLEKAIDLPSALETRRVALSAQLMLLSKIRAKLSDDSELSRRVRPALARRVREALALESPRESELRLAFEAALAWDARPLAESVLGLWRHLHPGRRAERAAAGLEPR